MFIHVIIGIYSCVEENAKKKNGWNNDIEFFLYIWLIWNHGGRSILTILKIMVRFDGKEEKNSKR